MFPQHIIDTLVCKVMLCLNGQAVGADTFLRFGQIVNLCYMLLIIVIATFIYLQVLLYQYILAV